MDGGNKDLYSINNPKYTLKNTGFKNEDIAKKTINIIKNRSILYQKTLINNLLYRAKNHPNKTEDMKKAINIFSIWLKKNKTKKRKYEYLDLDIIKKYEKLADIYNISNVSRGLEKSTRSDDGFLVTYKKVKGNKNKLSFIPIFKNKPEGLDYDSFRERFLNARLGQMKKSKDDFFYKDGKYKGLPTKQHLVLIMNAYSPYKREVLMKSLMNIE
jgi:hypothetical protein